MMCWTDEAGSPIAACGFAARGVRAFRGAGRIGARIHPAKVRYPGVRLSRSVNSFIHIACCRRETAAEQ